LRCGTIKQNKVRLGDAKKPALRKELLGCRDGAATEGRPYREFHLLRARAGCGMDKKHRKAPEKRTRKRPFRK